MKLNRSALPGRPSTWIVAMLLGLLAPLLATVSAQAAIPVEAAAPPQTASNAAAARAGFTCYGSAAYFGTPAGPGTSTGNVKLIFRVNCSERMRVIHVNARIDNNTTGDRHASNWADCKDVFFCEVTVVKDDNPSGWQTFAGFGSSCGLFADCATYAKPYEGGGTFAHDWECQDPQCWAGTGLELRKRTE